MMDQLEARNYLRAKMGRIPATLIVLGAGFCLLCGLIGQSYGEAVLEINAGRGGRMVVIGSRDTVTIDPRQAMMREADILRMIVFGATEKEFKVIHAALGAGLANGTLKPVVGCELPLAEAAEAHHDIMEKKSN